MMTFEQTEYYRKLVKREQLLFPIKHLIKFSEQYDSNDKRIDTKEIEERRSMLSFGELLVDMEYTPEEIAEIKKVFSEALYPESESTRENAVVLYEQLCETTNTMYKNMEYATYEELMAKYFFSEIALLQIARKMAQLGYYSCGLEQLDLSFFNHFLTKNPDYNRSCKECGNLLLGMRADAEFCGDTCKKAFHRKQ